MASCSVLTHTFLKEPCYHWLGAITLFLVGGLLVTFIKGFCYGFEATYSLAQGGHGVHQVWIMNEHILSLKMGQLIRLHWQVSFGLKTFSYKQYLQMRKIAFSHEVHFQILNMIYLSRTLPSHDNTCALPPENCVWSPKTLACCRFWK